MSTGKKLLVACIILLVSSARSFTHHAQSLMRSSRDGGIYRTSCQASQQTVQINATLDDDSVESLFAWVSMAFNGVPEYNNLMIAIAAIFGDLPDDSVPKQMLEAAKLELPEEETLVGDSLSIEDREYNSLGAMGAGQWMGQYKTRPHALLKLNSTFESVDDWVKTLPRGCKRTIKKALAQNFTVTTLPILDSKPAPHSSLACFRCVVAHEVRLLSHGVEGFLDALSEGISRYIGTTRMAGEIREYRNEDGKVIAVAHEVRKGTTVRGQWFYGDDEAAKRYVWFHSVYDLVRRAIDEEGIDVVDLGPSGSDSFSNLKARYGFLSYDDWPDHADYHGDFWYQGAPRKSSWF